MSELTEILMVVSFGISWPVNGLKAYRARTAKGTSLPFLLLIEFGYVAGIVSKLLAPSYKWYVLLFYVLNFITVSLNIFIYFRNKRFDLTK